ncbi:dihydropteroate synthase [bacterium D16-51]|nr:dihydropteroate synthase [bacterium D16-59]RKI59694.1 dihydropteroate synthase [bacterium D16-51]
MKIGKTEFDFNKRHTYVMGILNVTPDSFSDGGKFNRMDAALYHTEEMILQGADIIDIGGESTRPGYQKISAEEETERVVSVIEAVQKRFDVPISVDTYKAPVMDAALLAGGDMANDIWGLRYDSLFAGEGEHSVWDCGTMAEVIARHQVPVCVMHNRKKAVYQKLLEEILSDLEGSIQIGIDAGISEDRMILDPGIGFGKTYQDNLKVLASLEGFHKLNLPLLLAASRKSVIGLTLELPVEEREEGTLVTTVLAAQNGWNMVRVHDVEKSVRAIKMAEKIFSAM